MDLLEMVHKFRLEENCTLELLLGFGMSVLKKESANYNPK